MIILVKKSNFLCPKFDINRLIYLILGRKLSLEA